MALFADGLISGMEDLMAQDTQLSSVASTEGIDVTQKSWLAQEDLGLELTTLLDGSRRAPGSVWLSAQPGLQNVVVTPALKLWHAFRTLEMIYGDAYSSQLNDRYAAKRDQFHERTRGAYERVLLLGIGIAAAPLPRAKPPQITGTAGSLPDGTYYIAAAWVNSRNEEGSPSLTMPFTTAGGTFSVRPGPAPSQGSGWNVYVGTDPGAMSRQNTTPLGIDQGWTQPGLVSTGGNELGRGQSPNYVMTIPRMILRG